MQSGKFVIKPYNEKYKHQMLNVWEQSVLATHEFLTPSDFSEIKEAVQTINFYDFQVYCLTDDELVIGFIGVGDEKIEMLFLDPKYFRQGLGKVLVNFAVNELFANRVDVNVQNVKAVSFYRKFGFETYETTDKDDQGRSYPLFRMKLKDSDHKM